MQAHELTDDLGSAKIVVVQEPLGPRAVLVGENVVILPWASRSLTVRSRRAPRGRARTHVVAPWAWLTMAFAICGAVPQAVAADAVNVEVKGVLHDIMLERKTEPVAALAPTPDSHTYALGPLAGLAGEFAIVDDVVWVSKPAVEGAPITTRGAAGEQACLIVSARVPRWKRVVLENDVAFETLDATVRALAQRNGVDVSKPFPFLVEGDVAELSWHVIDGSKLPTAPDPLHPPHVIHRTASPNGVLARARAVLVGFYSTEHRGVFTHHDSDTHVHAVVDEPPLVAHVDGVRLLAGSTLALPE